MHKRLEGIRNGQLTVVDGSDVHRFGKLRDRGLAAEISIRDRRFYRSVIMGGSLGAAESYIRGDWDSPDLTAAMRVLAQNADFLAGVDRGMSQLLRPFRALVNRLRDNTRAGSRRNIAAHYDLSNEFFALMLDPSMTYSSGIFPSPTATLEEASFEKYDRICRKLQLTADDHVLEIGTGWGGFAEHAAKHYGSRITTTTISRQQFQYSQERLRREAIDDRVTLLQSDYRDLQGQFDKLVSIEMIEAVGAKYLRTFFSKCSALLKPNGIMALQAITIPDHRFDRYRRSVDFIQRYIFPGGFLPSMGAMADCVGRSTDFRFFHTEDFGSHYANTLSIWRDNFWRNIEVIKPLGFDRRFIRTWHYYLCYCEAGFRERQTGVSQFVFARPGYRGGCI
ncbi:MAG: cyclopropane-fatty-acyl-phospholipid synthase family protein [Pirellulales bacterium]|nr:cyclopropane-fatty-acyl-phospholipid synthase family protein [Pirellulales bacterium]